jgi:hypothetical protein
MFLHEVFTTREQCQDFALILGDSTIPAQLNQLTQRIAPQWRPKSVVDELRELRRCATVPLQYGIPL